MSQLLGSAEATLNGGSAGAELPVCRKAKPRLKQKQKRPFHMDPDHECGRFAAKKISKMFARKANCLNIKEEETKTNY